MNEFNKQNADSLAINTIKFLSAEMIQRANSGHPGLPLGAAPAAFTLWSKAMNHNPKNPSWKNRDRFVLSAGHGSALLYSMLHLFGYGLTIDDLKNFRQLDSKTPGHPEFGHTVGVEVTTGPLGQGIANAVGFAFAETYLAAKFNKDGYDIVDHYTYALCGDGCMMEGVASEAASLAGTMGLGKLIVLYDSNNITIEGSTEVAFAENVGKRYEAYGWHVQLVSDGNDTDAILKAIEQAKKVTDKPSLIEVKTLIGAGAPNKQGKASAHGEPLGASEIEAFKKAVYWEYAEDFHVPTEVRNYIDELNAKFADNEENWNKLMESYKKAYPAEHSEWVNWHSGELPDLLNDDELWKNEGNLATRVSSEVVLNRITKHVKNVVGGSADLAPSNKSVMKDYEYYSKENRGGANIHYGVREHAMNAIANGIALHGGLRTYIAGFFVFSDYMKGASRLSALMKLPVISILTHDSIGVGEDGPTHQPIEHLAALRSMPNYTVVRPCDTNETVAAWCLALSRTESPTAIVLTRQNLPLLPESGKGAMQGAYVLRDSENPDIILMASGSEVQLVYKAYDELKKLGVSSRVVSVPSFEVFEEQTKEYKENILPTSIRARLAVEAASSFGWHKYVGLDGDVISIDTFGASAPAETLFEKFGFTVENVVNKALKILGK